MNAGGWSRELFVGSSFVAKRVPATWCKNQRRCYCWETKRSQLRVHLALALRLLRSEPIYFFTRHIYLLRIVRLGLLRVQARSSTELLPNKV